MTCRLNQAATYFEWLYRQRSSTSATQHVTFNEIKDLAYGFMERVRRRHFATGLAVLEVQGFLAKDCSGTRCDLHALSVHVRYGRTQAENAEFLLLTARTAS